MSAPVQELQPPKIRWNLEALFKSPDDPRIEALWQELHQRADQFSTEYRGKINQPEVSAAFLSEALRQLELLARDASKPSTYAQLLFSTDTASPEIGGFMQEQMERSSELQVKLLFAELELQQIPEDQIARLIEAPELANYRHHILVARQRSPYRLSEKEEIILEETANTGIRAWMRLFEETTSAQTYPFIDPSTQEKSELTQEEVLNYLRHPERSYRQAAGDAFTEGLKSINRLITTIYNNVLLDKKIDDRLRNQPYPEFSRHLANELDKETVDLVVGLCKEHHHLVERYYLVKREILGLDQLTHVDRYAPLHEANEQIEWSEAESIVLDSFGSFHPELRERAAEFFDRGWIDAEPRAGKTGGAFCSYNTTDTHPVILMSYLNKMSDVETLAHELGHGVHASLSRAQTEFNYHGTLPLAELASIFGEILVFERLMAKASPEDQLALVAEKCEGIFASVFRQASMFRFEQRCHQYRREEGELTQDELGEFWQEELQSMFGRSIELGEQHKLWWSYVGHFFWAPFYVYAYAFGELLTLSLYAKAQAEGPEFSEKYIQVLKLGGSKSPEELMSLVGVDLRSKEFWLGGFQAIDAMVSRFESLWQQVKPTA
ncbi:MAG TPA: M3 family oligoendopeptidase [Fimbriimonadaceae bacterium]|nr:M3 family oligoendopeptidase [Fimbriimonadaceae bacterium]HRJ33321.1 M3 family oligoendopeptidase [Fimbriimonadaceae bacterium]